MRVVTLALLTALFTPSIVASPALAQATRAPAPAVQAPAAQPNPAIPQQTTASFADWTLRCSRITPAAQSCEVVQTITSQDRTVAQIAIGRIAKGQPLHLTILVPPSVTFGAAPSLTSTREGEPAVVDLVWRRCLPGGCMAEGTVSDDALRRVRGWIEPARISFADGSGRTAALPFSPRGLPQALDALAKEDAG
jgi:invasion protein IalB